MIAQKECEYFICYLYQQINQQLQVIQQLQYTIKQLECKLGFLVCENENLSSKRIDELINQQQIRRKLNIFSIFKSNRKIYLRKKQIFKNTLAKSQKDNEELYKVYSSLLDNYNLQNEKLKKIDVEYKELELNYQQLLEKKQQQDIENKNKMIQYVDCKQKLTFLTIELDRMNEVIQQQKQEFEQKQKKFENKQQILMMRIILHCAEIDRLIEVQSQLMNENKWYRNQVDLYAMMIGDNNNNKVVKIDF